MASFTQAITGAPHFAAHLADSPPTHLAISTKHLIFWNPVEAAMHSCCALTQSENPSTLENIS